MIVMDRQGAVYNATTCSNSLNFAEVVCNWFTVFMPVLCLNVDYVVSAVVKRHFIQLQTHSVSPNTKIQRKALIIWLKTLKSSMYY